ncbi:MAG: hypothetical protein EBU59_12805, partial [Planctomycetia bacterium]|nr:hypothetical protein [Planctomycetia bacterium]
MLLAGCLGTLASSSAQAQMQYRAARPQFQPQPQQQLRFAGQPTQEQSVLRDTQTLAMPLGEGEMIAPERHNTSASQDGSDEYGDDLFFMSGSCDDSGCCSICGANGCSGCDPWALFPNCTPPGMLQWMHAVHDSNKACWSTQVDA